MKTTTALGRCLALSLGLLFAATTFAQTSQTAGTGPNTTLTAAQMQAQLAAAQAQVRQLNQEMSNTIAATQAWQAQQPKPTSAQIAAQQAAVAANQQAAFEARFKPWLQPVTLGPNGVPQSLDDLAAASRAAASQLAAKKRAEYLQDQAKVDAFLAKFPTNMFHKRPARIDETGRPVFLGFLDTYQDEDTFVQPVWANSNPSLDLKGDGQTNFMWDGGNVRTTHVELIGRAFHLDNNSGGDADHATAVAGVMGARGVNATAVGVAPNVTIYSGDAYNAWWEMPLEIATNNMLQCNHSYGSISVGWVSGAGYGGGAAGPAGIYAIWTGDTNVSLTEDPNFGNYQGYAIAIDDFIYNYPTTVMCWAAGNERGSDGQPQYATSPLFIYWRSGIGSIVVISPQNGNWFAPPNVATVHNGYFTLIPNSAAKNSIVVGATTENTAGYTGYNSVGNTSYASWGPARDGRIKPDLAGVGGDTSQAVYCPASEADNVYSYDLGTSFATPNVTGAVALMRQCWNQYNPANYPALASTIKAILIHTASQVGPNPGPNFATGWGLVNVSDAVGVIRANFNGFTLANLPLTHVKEILLQNGTANSFPITVPAGTPQLKVTMVWTDPPGANNPQNGVVNTGGVLLASQKALVNDLDLRLISPSGTTYSPWVLDPVNFENPATTGDDSINNVEVVEVSNPPAGVYTVRVTHKGTLTGSPQAFSLVMTGNVDGPVPPLNISDSMMLNPPANQVALAWPSVPGGVYQVLYSTDVASAAWSPAANPITAGQANAAVVLPINPSDTARFFRLARLK